MRLGWCLGTALLVLAGAIPASAAVSVVPLVTGLSQPTFVTHAGDGSGRLFITEQPGRIKVLPPGSSTPTVFLDITPLVESPASGGGNEEGLLSVAFHPSYGTNGFFYVYYTDTSGNNNVVRYTVSGDPNVANPASAFLVLNIPHPTFSNHNGGQLNFGPDGFLYIATGDGGGTPNNAQSLTSLLGKLLRLDVDGGTPYAAPASNPFFGMGGGVRQEIWALGLRNPWRFAFDRLTHDIVIGDVGQNLREELDFQPAGVGGRNYCWPVFEGTLFASGTCTLGSPTPPILEYGTHDAGRCAITGGYVYRGSAGTLPAGTYLFGDFCSGEIFTLAGGLVTLQVRTGLFITSFGEDAAGEIYAVIRGTGSTNGSIQRLVGTAGLELQVGLNRLLAYRTGNALSVGVAARNSGSPLSGDFYLGAILPDGQLAFITSLSPLSVVILPGAASPASFPRLSAAVALPSGFAFPMQTMFGYTFSGGEAAGVYHVFAALTTAGALADGSLGPGDLLFFTSQDLTFTPPSPGGARTPPPSPPQRVAGATPALGAVHSGVGGSART